METCCCCWWRLAFGAMGMTTTPNDVGTLFSPIFEYKLSLAQLRQLPSPPRAFDEMRLRELQSIDWCWWYCCCCCCCCLHKLEVLCCCSCCEDGQNASGMQHSPLTGCPINKCLHIKPFCNKNKQMKIVTEFKLVRICSTKMLIIGYLDVDGWADTANGKDHNQEIPFEIFSK